MSNHHVDCAGNYLRLSGEECSKSQAMAHMKELSPPERRRGGEGAMGGAFQVESPGL